MAKNKLESMRYDSISELGCIAQVLIDDRIFTCGKPAEIHHLKGHEFGTGIAKKAAFEFSIGLCVHHHRGGEGFHVIGKNTWEAMFGTQQSLLDLTNKRLRESLWTSVN